MPRSLLAAALLCSALAQAQVETYFAPITVRSPGTAPVGGTATLRMALALPDAGIGVDQSTLVAGAGAAGVGFTLGSLLPATLTSLPGSIDAVATAPGVLVGVSSQTLIAISSGGTVTFGTLDGTAFHDRTAAAPVVAGTGTIALSAVADGGAALLVSDGRQITRWDLDISNGTVQPTLGPSGSDAPSDAAFSLVFDGRTEVGFSGGSSLGLYVFDSRLDAGPPTIIDTNLLDPTRLSPPVTGLALYGGRTPLYLLASHQQGLTIYPLTGIGPPLTADGIIVSAGTVLSRAVKVIATDSSGQITAPLAVAVTNVDAGPPYYGGVIVLADTDNTFANVRWDLLAQHQVDGGLVVDPTDPRIVGFDGGSAVDGGCPDGGPLGPDGGCGPGGPTGGPVVPTPPGPGIQINQPSSCASAAGAPGFAALVAVGGLLFSLRRQRR